MKAVLLRWNPEQSQYSEDDFIYFLTCTENDDPDHVISWDLSHPEKINDGDLFIILKVGADNDGIVALGEFVSMGDEDAEDHLDLLCVFRREKYTLLSSDDLATVCPSIDWHKSSAEEEFLTLKETAAFFPLIAKLFTYTDGSTPFIRYSFDAHPCLDETIQRYAAELCPAFTYTVTEWPVPEPDVYEDLRLSKSSRAMLKMHIGERLLYCQCFMSDDDVLQTYFEFNTTDCFMVRSNTRIDGKENGFPLFVLPRESVHFIKETIRPPVRDYMINEIIGDISIISDEYVYKSDITGEERLSKIDMAIVFDCQLTTVVLERLHHNSVYHHTRYYQKGNYPGLSVGLSAELNEIPGFTMISAKRVITSLADGSVKLVTNGLF